MLQEVSLFLLMTMCHTIFAIEPTLVFDSDNNSPYPKRFRSTAWSHPSLLPKMIGSGQFNKQQLKTILQDFKSFDVYVIDLRKESHGILNNQLSFSWYAIKNWGNVGKNAQQVSDDEHKGYKKLLEQPETEIFTIKQKSENSTIVEKKSFRIKVTKAISEQTYLLDQNIANKRFYISDRKPASNTTIDEWIKFIKKHQSPKTVFFIHCRGGSGRTTQFMTIADIFFNSKRDSLKTILNRQVTIGGKDLRQFPAKTHFAYQHAINRLNLIKDVYLFSKQYDKGIKVFSTWRALKKSL